MPAPLPTPDLQPPPAAAAAARPGELAALLAFCRAHGAPCFVHWPDNILAEYLCFHARHGSLATVRAFNPQLSTLNFIGLAVGWQCHEAELERHWYVTNPAGDAFYFAHCIATEPRAVAALIEEWKRRIPAWPLLKLYARRGAKGLTRYPHRLLQRLYERAL